MSTIEQHLTELSPEQRRLVELLLREEKEKSAPRAGSPLSFAQQRLWFLDQLQPGSAAYNMPFAWRLTGPLDVAAVSRSLNEIVRRHHVLRATFATEAGQPIQMITPPQDTPLPVESLEALPEAEREARALKLALEESRQPFDLARGPLLRARLLRLSAAEHVLLITMHHIVCDGWSTGVLLRELATLYTAFADSQTESPLPELPWQYADYAVWQRERLQGDLLEAQLAYWKNQLAHGAPRLDLPTDRPRPPMQSLKGETRWWTFPRSLREALKELSRREGVTLFTLLLAAFQALLQRYSGQTDIVVGTPIANRPRAEVEGLIGFFVNTLAMRLDLSGDPTFRELLARAREVCLGAYAHQDLPFEKLVEALQVRRDPSRSPLFQVMLALQNAPLPVVERAGLTLSPIEVDNGLARFDLALSLTEREAGLAGVLKYNTDLFDAVTIDRFLGHFQTLLEALVADPEQRLSTLPLLTETEQRQLLVEWNATQVEYPREWCVHQLFETQVEQMPDRIAVSATGPSPLHLTYAELDRRANQLAHHLQTLGVGPEVRVGVCVERSLEMVVGLLGVLKAGGGYVPLDPAYPADRLAFMLEDSRATMVLTQSHVWEQLKGAGGWGLGVGDSPTSLCLDTDWDLITTGPQSPVPSPQPTPENLAYVIYTSGSTGRPKGVLVAHQGLGNLAQAQIKTFGVRPESRILQFASLSFDASVSEIIMALLGGATLCLASSDSLRPGPDLIRLLRDEAIDVVTLPPSVLAVLPEASLPALKTIVTAGEACSAELVTHWTKQQRLINAYGPTEATVCATMGECQANDQSPPIGRAMDNTQVYILDSHLNPVPVGVPGELHIGGVGLARGYLGQPDLTAERFIPNPFFKKDEGGSMKDEKERGFPFILHTSAFRLYKTGDLARYLPDGNIEFLGRLDHQVKVRGYRIELGEIESVLRRYPGVQEAVVSARPVAAMSGQAQAVGGEKQLAAYLVSAPGEPLPSVSDLRRFLQAQLPDYMLPTTCLFLESLPLTPNGKVDRKALPAPEGSRPKLEAAFVAPRTPIEETLAGIWAQVLSVEQIGVHDNFFELGGHSLLATQIVAKIRAAFQVELPLALLFNALTVADLAREVAQAQIQATGAQNLDDVLNQLEGLSDEEVAVLLGEGV